MHTHVRTHTPSLTEWKWTGGEMQSTVGQFSLELVEHGEKSHVRTDQGKEADSDKKKSAHKDAAGES